MLVWLRDSHIVQGSYLEILFFVLEQLVSKVNLGNFFFFFFEGEGGRTQGKFTIWKRTCQAASSNHQSLAQDHLPIWVFWQVLHRFYFIQTLTLFPNPIFALKRLGSLDEKNSCILVPYRSPRVKKKINPFFYKQKRNPL